MPGSATEPARLRIVAFSSESESQVFRLNSYSPAYFVSGPGQGTIVLSRLTKESLPDLKHEYIHALVHENGWHLPLWLAEGLAEHLAGVAPDRAKHYRKVLKEQGLPSLRQLESVNVPYQDRQPAEGFYAASWALVRLLSTEVPYRQHFAEFVRGGASLTAWLAGLDRDEAQLQTDLRALTDGLQQVAPDAGTTPIQVECSIGPADGVTIQLALARLQEQTGDLTGSRARLAALPETARRSPEYWTLSGDLSMRAADSEDARYSYEKAWDLGSLDSRMLHRLAALERDRPAALPVLERLVEVTPANDEARLILSSHYLNRHRWPDALAQLHQVKRAPPERMDFYRQAIALAESHLEPTPVLLSTR